MSHITLECVEKEIENLLEHGTFNYGNLERFNILCKARKYLCEYHHELTEEDAKAWVAHMNPPAKWTMEQTTDVMNKQGYTHRPCEFYAVMNALYSDYGKTLAKFGADKPEAWAALANDFICDADAVEGKAGRYYKDIVRH